MALSSRLPLSGSHLGATFRIADMTRKAPWFRRRQATAIIGESLQTPGRFHRSFDAEANAAAAK